MNHSYDQHAFAVDCFNITQNRNKESLKEFRSNIENFIQLSKTNRKMVRIEMNAQLITLQDQMKIL